MKANRFKGGKGIGDVQKNWFEFLLIGDEH